jgi:hypothetical protein
VDETYPSHFIGTPFAALLSSLEYSDDCFKARCRTVNITYTGRVEDLDYVILKVGEKVAIGVSDVAL